MKRLELTRVRVCERCGRGSAELRSAEGDKLVVPLDPVQVRQLSGKSELPSLTELVLEQLAAGPIVLQEVVIDLGDSRLRGLVSFTRGESADVVECAPGEALALSVRGSLALYATDDAIAHGRRSAPGDRRGGPDTVH